MAVPAAATTVMLFGSVIVAAAFVRMPGGFALNFPVKTGT